ncbi:hypothetical protein [Kitasatospora griseola]
MGTMRGGTGHLGRRLLRLPGGRDRHPTRTLAALTLRTADALANTL